MWAQRLGRIENEAMVIDHEEEADPAGTVVIILRMQKLAVIIVIYLDILEGNVVSNVVRLLTDFQRLLSAMLEPGHQAKECMASAPKPLNCKAAGRKIFFSFECSLSR